MESDNESVFENEGAGDEETSTLEGVVQTFAEFDHQRAEQEEHALQDSFRFTLLGGRWQAARTGREVYGMRCD
eukprot:5002387-Amphidinium_carterae.1